MKVHITVRSLLQFSHAVQRGHSCRLSFNHIGTRVAKSLKENLNPCGAAPNQRGVLLSGTWLSFPVTLQDLLKKLGSTSLQLLTRKRTKARNTYWSLQLSRWWLHVRSTSLHGRLKVKRKKGSVSINNTGSQVQHTWKNLLCSLRRQASLSSFFPDPAGYLLLMEPRWKRLVPWQPGVYLFIR